jgi:hypothetical protein
MLSRLRFPKPNHALFILHDIRLLYIVPAGLFVRSVFVFTNITSFWDFHFSVYQKKESLNVKQAEVPEAKPRVMLSPINHLITQNS